MSRCYNAPTSRANETQPDARFISKSFINAFPIVLSKDDYNKRKQHISTLEVLIYEQNDYENAHCRAVGSLRQDAPSCRSCLIHTITIPFLFTFRNLIWRIHYEKHEIHHVSSPDRLGLIPQTRWEVKGSALFARAHRILSIVNQEVLNFMKKKTLTIDYLELYRAFGDPRIFQD